LHIGSAEKGEGGMGERDRSYKDKIPAGANPTIVSYNASAVKIYIATSSLVHYENKNIFFYIL
jgi:hypothetical protein